LRALEEALRQLDPEGTRCRCPGFDHAGRRRR
jgi:hypothetical protein